MTERINSSGDFRSPTGARLPTEHQETVLLGEFPEVQSAPPEQTDTSNTPAHLSTATLAALTQRYDILAEAGHGSIGNVYKARDRETGEVVALKLLKPEIASDQAMMERFKNELLFARKITHKNVCRVYDFNRIGGVAYTSMEFVEGESLRAMLNRPASFAAGKATDLVLQICSGLKEAHAQGIVHRDLKPENVMIDPQGNVKIMDFGIARSMEAVTRMTGAMMGTPAYMAPEQVAGKSADYRTDVYALGLILYEVFTGAQAFRADNAVAVALKQMRESPAPPHEANPTIPVPIERAILKCLEKEPAKRFASIADLEGALRGTDAPAGATAAVAPVSVSAANIARAALPVPRQAQPMPATAPMRTPLVAWLVLAASVSCAALGAWRAVQINEVAARIAPPPPFELPAPKPPDFALSVLRAPAATAPAAPAASKAPEIKTHKQSAAAAAPLEGPSPAPPKPADAAGIRQTPFARNRSQFAAQGSAGNGIPQNRAKSFGGIFGSQNGMKGAGGGGYLWVGRFQREDRAQDASKKIEDMGLSAVVIPRQTPTGEFFVVLTGPFGPKKLPGVLQWLQTQGFPNAHAIKAPGENSAPNLIGRPNS
jgi:hypothetical protein